MKIRHKIIVPFSLLTGAAILTVWLFSIKTIRTTVLDGARQQTRDVGRMVLRPGFPLSDKTLARISELVGYEMMIRSSSYVPLYASHEKFFRLRRVPVEKLRKDPGLDQYEIFRHSSPDPGQYLLVFFPRERIRKVEQKAAKGLLAIAGSTLLAVLVVGVFIAHTITRPVLKLSDRAGQISRGEVNQPLDVSAGGEIGKLVSSFETMRKDLLEYQEELKDNERLTTLGQLASALAHEIRNPVTSLKMSIQIMREKMPDQSARLDSMLSDLRRLETDVSQILDYGRPLNLQSEPVSVSGAAKAVADFFKDRLKHAGVELEIPSPELNVKVFADPDRLRQILLNLVGNALDAMPGGGKVSIMTERHGSDVLITVTDQGPGIPIEEREKIFEPFMTTKSAGCGLGLAVTKRFAEAMDGKVEVVESDRGAAFEITLPAAGK